MLSSCIDWLSVTFPTQSGATKFLSAIKERGNSKDINPRFGYDSAVEYEIGITVMWCIERDDMGAHVILPGSALLTLSETMPGIAPLRLAVDNGAKVTRLDLAIDAQNEGIDILEIYSSESKGESKGTAQTVNLITGNDGSATMYVGSRVSDKFARLYDKAKQTKQAGDWKRLEIELKGDAAKQYGRALLNLENTSIASVAWNIAEKMFYTDAGNYPVFGMDTHTVSMPKIEKKTNTEKWLLEQIIPAIEKFVRQHPESNVYDLLIDALINAKKSKGLT